MGGERPPVVGGILDYTQTQTTARYAHHPDDPLYLPTMRTCKIVPYRLGEPDAVRRRDQRRLAGQLPAGRPSVAAIPGEQAAWPAAAGSAGRYLRIGRRADSREPPGHPPGRRVRGADAPPSWMPDPRIIGYIKGRTRGAPLQCLEETQTAHETNDPHTGKGHTLRPTLRTSPTHASV